MLLSEQPVQAVETTSDTGPMHGDQVEQYRPSAGLPYVPTTNELIDRVGRERGIIPPDAEAELPLALAHQRIGTLTKQRNALAESGDTLIVYLQRAMRNLPRSEREMIEADMRGEAQLVELGIIDIVFPPPPKRHESR
jgi:hypothetical protein